MRIYSLLVITFLVLPYKAWACKMLTKGWENYSKRAVKEHLKKSDHGKEVQAMELDSGKVLVYFKGQKPIEPQKYRVAFDGDCSPTVYRIMHKKIKTH